MISLPVENHTPILGKLFIFGGTISYITAFLLVKGICQDFRKAGPYHW